jgi:capsid protein
MTLALTTGWRARNAMARRAVALQPVAPAAPTNLSPRFEAARRFSTRRSYIDPNLRDARKDLSPPDRETMAAKSQSLDANASLFTRMLDLFQLYTVGPTGFQFLCGGEDPDWAARYAEVWAEECLDPDLSSELDMAGCQNVSAREWPVNGGSLVVLTRSAFPYRPKIQLLDYRRLRTPEARAFTDQRIFDGFELTPKGRPTYAFIAKDYDGETFSRVPMDGVVHIFEPQRAGQYRGLPFLYSGIDELHDLKDLHHYEMGAAKEFARNAKFIKTQSGEVDAEGALTGTVTGSDGVDATQFYEQSFGSETKVLRNNDEIVFPSSNRPGPAAQWHWETLETNACNAFGMSKLLIKPYSVQGTVGRAILAADNAFFSSCSTLLAAKWLRVHLHFMDWRVANDPRLKNPPKGWRNIEVQPPRTVDVDVGRNAAALISEYEAGFRTIQEICTALGKNYRAVLRQKGAELKLAMQIEAEMKLPPGSLIQSILAAIKQDQPAPAPAPLAP